LANDIADQRARGDRANVATGLLQSGRTLFPEYADLLEQGQAGTQDASAQVLTAEKPSDSAATPK